jgi:hypothetical protein
VTLGKIAIGSLSALIGAAAPVAIDHFDVIDKIDPPDPIACPRTSTSSKSGDPKPTAQATVIIEGQAVGREGGVVGFKICHDVSPDAVSEYWYYGTSPGPNTNLAPANRIPDVDPPRYQTLGSTVYSVDCATNIFAYQVTDEPEHPYGFDQSQC